MTPLIELCQQFFGGTELENSFEKRKHFTTYLYFATWLKRLTKAFSQYFVKYELFSKPLIELCAKTFELMQNFVK